PLVTAVVTKTFLPHTTGLECPRPGISVFHLVFSDFSAFQVTAEGCPSTTPEAPGPRNWGQFCAFAAVAPAAMSNRERKSSGARFIVETSSWSVVRSQLLVVSFFTP